MADSPRSRATGDDPNHSPLGVTQTPASEECREPSPAFAADQRVLTIDLGIYHVDAVFRTAYRFSDRCVVFLERPTDRQDRLRVTIAPRLSGLDLQKTIGDFANDLLDQQLRVVLAHEAGPLRDLIVAQAFAEGNLLEPRRDDGDVGLDPLRITRPDREVES